MLHDSTVSRHEDEVVLLFSAVYLHRSSGRPGVDAGAGWWQPATLTLSGVSAVTKPAELPASLADGVLRIGSEIHQNIIPADGTFEGAIELSLVLVTGETWAIRGERLRIRRHGMPSSIESFRP